MLYSGPCEQPARTSGAARRKPAKGRNEVTRRRSRSVDSVLMSDRPHVCRMLDLTVLATSSIPMERTSLPTVNPNPAIIWRWIEKWNRTTYHHAYLGRWVITRHPRVFAFDWATELRTESIRRRYRSIPSHQMISLRLRNSQENANRKMEIAREDDVHRYFGIGQYVRPIDAARQLCLNGY